MSDLHSILLIAVIAVVTMITRFLPFMIFRNNKNIPKYILDLGSWLPFAIMGMLVVYCLKGISFVSAPYGLPEIIACVFVVLLHKTFRNTLLSIGFGTISYMILVQVVF